MPATATMKAMSPSDIRVIANMDAKRSTPPAFARWSDCLHRKLTNARTPVSLEHLSHRRLVSASGGGSRSELREVSGERRAGTGRGWKRTQGPGCKADGVARCAGGGGCCWVPAADAGMTFGEARGDWAGSEEPMDADGQAMKGLGCWLHERFGAVRVRWARRLIP